MLLPAPSAFMVWWISVIKQIRFLVSVYNSNTDLLLLSSQNKNHFIGIKLRGKFIFFSLGATAPVWALAYLNETLRFTSVF
jgi:hypothetical protein